MGSNQFDNFSNPKTGENSRITARLQSAPYFKYFAQAQDKAIKKDATPYVRTYMADAKANEPIQAETVPAPVSLPKAAPAKAVKNGKSSKKRVLVIILVTLFALIGAAIPFVSSLGILSDYINIGQDILGIATIFAAPLTLESITANIPLIILALYTLIIAIVFILSVISLFSSKRIGVGLLAFMAFVLGAGYLVTALPDLITLFVIDGLFDEYGKLALVGLPLLIFIISTLRYKKH
ncbi:MAG: hypothetical protein ACOYIQ_06400 [Christensenellales bacterium]|jgi:hypothetical protein